MSKLLKFHGYNNPPRAPVGLAATPGVEEIDLEWTVAEPNKSEIIVERCTDNLTFLEIDSIDGALISFNDPGLENSTTYYYRLRTEKNGVFSPYTATVSATPEESY